jgi:hypothetical protein
MRLIKVLATMAAGVAMTWSGSASALTVRLDYIWGGNGGGTTVFIHGHGNCVGGNGSDSRCVNLPYGYWLNSTEDGGDGHDFMAEATSKCTASGCSMSCASSGCSTINYSGSWTYSEAFTIRYDMVNQSMMSSVNDVARCLVDLRNGTNASGCNPKLYRRTSFRVVGHSAGGAVIDRMFSTNAWPELTGSSGAIVGNPVASSGAFAGSKAASALYGTDGASNFCTSLVSWVAGWAFKSSGNASLTRGSVIGEARNGRAGKSPRWIYKITTPGGSGSANNSSRDSIKEDVNDGKMGLLAGCVGFSSNDDTDGVLWQFDSDPTSSPSTSNGGKYIAEYTGRYWRWVASWANHSHNRNDAYVRKYGFQNFSGCYSISPGTCIGQYAQ